MTPQTRTSLKELQHLDQEIAAIRSSAQSFEPLLEEVDAPVAPAGAGGTRLSKSDSRSSGSRRIGSS